MSSAKSALFSAAKPAGIMTNNDKIIDKIIILFIFFNKSFPPNS